MSEIKININELNNSISKLQTLTSQCTSNLQNAPVTVGGGKTVNELEAIAGQYRTINLCLEKLMNNTILFLKNIKESYVSSDQKAARGIDG